MKSPVHIWMCFPVLSSSRSDTHNQNVISNSLQKSYRRHPFYSRLQNDWFCLPVEAGYQGSHWWPFWLGQAGNSLPTRRRVKKCRIIWHTFTELLDFKLSRYEFMVSSFRQMQETAVRHPAPRANKAKEAWWSRNSLSFCKRLYETPNLTIDWQRLRHWQMERS